MRIAMTHAHCWPEVLRGGERYLHELSAALVRGGHDVTIWSASHDPSERVEEGVRVVRLARRYEGMRHEIRFGWSLLPHLLREKYDVIHSLGPCDATAAIIARRLGRARRTVFTNLGVADRALWRDRRDRRYHDFVGRFVDVYAALSPYAASFVERSYGRPGTVTSGGVRLDRFPIGTEREQTPTLLFAGAFDDPMKRVPVLLEAMAIIADVRPEARLWMVGPGDPRPHLDAAPAAAVERTSVLSRDGTDVAPYFGRAWASVLPSLGESFGLVIVESMSCGTPVIATTSAASPERVVPGTGVLCAPDDPAALARACLEGLELSTEPGIRERCRAAAAPYDWDAMLPEYERIYRGAL